MIYLVSNNTRLFESFVYKTISVEQSLEILKSWDIIQYDSETTGRDPHICKPLCIQFGNRAANIQIVVDVTTVDILNYKEILETKLLIGHYLQFDIKILYKFGIIPSRVWDTMIIEQFLYLGYSNKYIRYSLQAVAERRLGVYIDKSIRGDIIWRGLDDDVIEYSAGDVVYLEDIRDQQLQECKEKSCLLGAEVENAFVPVIAYLEWCGIKLDEDKWKYKMKTDQLKLKESEDKLNDWIVDYYLKNKEEIEKIHNFCIYENNHGRESTFTFDTDKWTPIGMPKKIEDRFGIIYKMQSCKLKFPYVQINLQGNLFTGIDESPHSIINWSSSQQVIPLVQLLGFNTETRDKKTGKSKQSVEAKLLAKQKGINDEFLKRYFEYQEASKVCSTYGQNFLDTINPITGRIHTVFRQLGTISGRMSSGDSKNSNTELANLKKLPVNRVKYPNIQNLPADKLTRGSFVSSKGNLLVSSDYSALESRLGADIYNEPSMINEYLHGSGDIHSLVAKKCFPKELEGIDVKDVKRLRPDLRKDAKSPEFAKQFGGSYKAIMNSLGCSAAKAKAIDKAYTEGFPGIQTFQKRGSLFVKTYGYIIICKKTGHRMNWEGFKKWKEIEDLPEVNKAVEVSSEEWKEHNKEGSKWDRMALNAPTQGSGIIILKTAMVSFFNWIKQNNYFNKVLICNLIHDEAVVEFPERLKDIVPNKLKDCMERAAALYCDKVPIPAEPEVGDHWIH